MKKHNDKIKKIKNRRTLLGVLLLVPAILFGGYNLVFPNATELQDETLKLLAMISMVTGFYCFLRATDSYIRDEEIEKKLKTNTTDYIISKTRKRRIAISVTYYLFIVLILYIKYMLMPETPETGDFKIRIGFLLVIFFVITVYTTKYNFIFNQLEDKKLKQANHKFKFSEQWFKYVPADVVNIILNVVSLYLTITIGDFLLNNDYLQTLKYCNLIAWLSMATIQSGFLILWGVYCNVKDHETAIANYTIKIFIIYLFAFIIGLS